jgi:hypothetical protein
MQWLNEEQLIEKVINLFAVEKPPESPASDLSPSQTQEDVTKQQASFYW